MQETLKLCKFVEISTCVGDAVVSIGAIVRILKSPIDGVGGTNMPLYE